MGCHPSHWRTHIFQDGECTTNQQCLEIVGSADVGPMTWLKYLSSVPETMEKSSLETWNWCWLLMVIRICHGLWFFPLFVNCNNNRLWSYDPKYIKESQISLEYWLYLLKNVISRIFMIKTWRKSINFFLFYDRLWSSIRAFWSGLLAGPRGLGPGFQDAQAAEERWKRRNQL